MYLHRILISTLLLWAVIGYAGDKDMEINSWNLSRSMLINFTTNPFGIENVWTAMYDSAGTSHNLSNYLPMSTYDTQYQGYPWIAWENPDVDSLSVRLASEIFIFDNGTSHFINIPGLPYLHPGPTYSSIIRWKSPIRGIVNIMGRITDIDTACGNGIQWFIDKGNFTILSGTIDSNHRDTKILKQNIPVSVGSEIYFIVSPYNDDYICDSTSLDIVITKQ